MCLLRSIASTALVLLCCSRLDAEPDRTPRTSPVLEWNAVMVTTVATLNPFAQARAAAMTHLAVFDAVNAITPRYGPYLASPPALSHASPDAAAIAAAHLVLRTLVPAAAPSLDAARAASLAVVPEGPTKLEGIAVGEAAAAAMLAARASDGSAPPQFHVPASADAGEWQATPACPPAGGY